MAKITFEFDYYEDRDEVDMIRNASQMYCALNEIYNLVRSELKHSSRDMSPEEERLLEKIRDTAWEFGQ